MFILILLSCKVFIFQRKVERKDEILRIMKEAATRILTQFSVNVKEGTCSLKENTRLKKIVMPWKTKFEGG